MMHLSERWHVEIDVIGSNQCRPVIVHNISLVCSTDIELSAVLLQDRGEAWQIRLGCLRFPRPSLETRPPAKRLRLEPELNAS